MCSAGAPTKVASNCVQELWRALWNKMMTSITVMNTHAHFKISTVCLDTVYPAFTTARNGHVVCDLIGGCLRHQYQLLISRVLC